MPSRSRLFVVKNVRLRRIIYVTYLIRLAIKGLPNVLVSWGMLVALFVFITKRMTFGRRIYAMGGNVKAAALSGIKTERLTFLTFVIMGMLAALGRPDLCRPAQYGDPEGRARVRARRHRRLFIGGASAMGGVGRVAGAVIGALIMGVMNNGMCIMGISID